jgi:hypothetical protein
MPPQHDPTLQAPVDPFAPQQPTYDQPAYPGSPAYPSYNDPVGYPDPVSGYPGQQQPYSGAGYGTPGYQQPQQQPPYYQPPQQPTYGQPGYPAYGQPSGGGGGKAVVAVLIVVLVLILVGGGIAAFVLLGNKPKPTPTAGPTGNGTATSGSTDTTTAPPAAATHDGDIASYLISAPSGSRNWNASDCKNGALSIDDASKLSTDANARRDMLNQYGFKDGARLCWIGSDHSVVDIRLYRFDTVDHGNSFFKDDINATSGDYTSSNTTTVPGVPGAENYVDPKVDAQGYVASLAIGGKGDIVFVVSLSEKAQVLDTTLPYGLMLQEYQKL